MKVSAKVIPGSVRVSVTPEYNKPRKPRAKRTTPAAGDSFGCPGYFRMAYCIETEKVRRSFAALERFVAAEYGVTKQ